MMDHTAVVVAETKGYELTKTGLVFTRSLSDAEYESLGTRIAAHVNASAWALGDWILAGAGRGPDFSAYERAQDRTGRSYESLSQYCRVSAAYGHEERGLVPWSFYREALRLPSKERVQALQIAKTNHWNRNGLIGYVNTRLGEDHALDAGAHDSAAAVKRIGRAGWRKATAPKRDVRCPQCGHVFDVRRKGLTEQALEVIGPRV